MNHHKDALFLALASSSDNFLVGFSLALSGKRLDQKFMWFISVCNALGCMVATQSGSFVASYIPHEVILCIAGLAFLYLAIAEYFEVRYSKDTTCDASYKLALPMTINNLAGGASGGLIGIPAPVNAGYALLVSLLTMAGGYFLARQFTRRVRRQSTTNKSIWLYTGVYLYTFLSLQSFYDSYTSSL